MGLAIAKRSIRFEADILFNRLMSNGTYAGFIPMSNITSIGIQPQSATDTIIGTELDNAGQSLDAISVQDQLLVTMSGNRFYGATMALALMGDESEITAGTENVTGELVRMVGGTGHLGNVNVTAASVVIRGLTITVDSTTGFAAGSVLTNSTTGIDVGVIHDVPDATSIVVFQWYDAPLATHTVTDGTNTATVSATAAANTEAVLTTDFTVTEEEGRVLAVDSGTLDVAALTKVMVDYTYTKIAGSRILIGSNTIIKGQLKIKARNKVDAKYYGGLLRQITISPNTAMTLMSADERSTIEWQGVAETPTGFTDPGWLNLPE